MSHLPGSTAQPDSQRPGSFPMSHLFLISMATVSTGGCFHLTPLQSCSARVGWELQLNAWGEEEVRTSERRQGGKTRRSPLLQAAGAFHAGRKRVGSLLSAP